ncbi:30S ribosomal protein S1 [Ananas comosus]|uniref:30S ribosomal protein S1 n=1 Tax=Ananas comosus TaxID=4615 RepID=A0A199W3N3_ANACO|nr:30S ribosomal protein S1 [Ananas comosus]
MEALAACSLRGGGGAFLLRLPSPGRKRHHRPPRRFPAVRASREEPELDEWDHMEIKFGRLLGEDPKLTLAKIMARKSNPDVSYFDVEKALEKKKNKLEDVIVDFSSEAKRPSASPKSTYSSTQKEGQKMPIGRNLNLSRPTMGINLSRPTMGKAMQATSPDKNQMFLQMKPNQVQGSTSNKAGNSEITLRKPSIYQGDDDEGQSTLKFKPNLFLKMRKGSSENLSNMTLLKKPEVMKVSSNSDQENVPSDGFMQASSTETEGQNEITNALNPNETSGDKINMDNEIKSSDGFPREDLDKSAIYSVADVENDGCEETVEVNSGCISESLELGLQPTEQSRIDDLGVSTTHSDERSKISSSTTSSQTALLGKPQRVDSSVRRIPQPTSLEKDGLNDDQRSYVADAGQVISSEEKEIDESDWKSVEHLCSSGQKVEVELISCSGRGFVVSFRSLIGFLPYRNLGAKWKFLAFESWLRKKGIDPSLYRQNLGVVGNFDVNIRNPELELSETQEGGPDSVGNLETNMKFEDLLKVYDQEKTKFLSSFIGQRIRVSIVMADRNSRRIMFSGRPKEKEELVEKKRSLMARLSVGDVVQCCIKKFTYFGIFVEVEGVPALIHQSEVSWDATLDPSSSFKIVEAKVHQLDYTLERITLSLKDIMPNPLSEVLESVIGERTSLDGTMEVAQADAEWPDVELLMQELQKIKGVDSVSKGRFFLSPGLAPTFQVYMAPMFDNKYKLLARYENQVQEIMVQASLDREQIKAAILECTKRVG